jgi:hypothetical protein
MNVVMSTQNTLYTRSYPLSRGVRISRGNLERIKRRGIAGDSINDCLSRILDSLEEFEKRGYETKAGEKSN